MHCHKSITDTLNTVNCLYQLKTQRTFWKIWVAVCVWFEGSNFKGLGVRLCVLVLSFFLSLKYSCWLPITRTLANSNLALWLEPKSISLWFPSCSVTPITLGARDFSSAVSSFCQVFIATCFAARGFGLRPKMCRPSASAENSRRTRMYNIRY